MTGSILELMDGDGKRVISRSEDFTHERPVLLADGKPFEEGETVYLVPGEHCDHYPLYGYHGGDECKVVPNEAEGHRRDGRIAINKGTPMQNGYALPEQLTHTQPDTQARIDDDAMRDPGAYCAEHCHDYTGLWDGWKERAWMNLDLLRRQRELDARGMGGARWIKD